MMYCLQQKGDFTTKLQKQRDVLVMKVMNPLNKLRWMDELHRKLDVEWWDVDFRRDCVGQQHDDIVLSEQQVKELRSTFRITKKDFPLTYTAVYKQLLDCYNNVFPTVVKTTKVKDKRRRNVYFKAIDPEQLMVLQRMLKHKNDYYEEVENAPAFDDFND
mmetsp:Transcript_3729/g.14160  ORF Transcript_3729/g.14160 Transcript_3729/m.14160 type:complete len:160 (-) Transcript_3729:59-538(-)